MGEFCWSPVVMNPHVKTGSAAADCHSAVRFLKSRQSGLSEYNSTKSYPEGTEVICECYDDYVARQKTNYLELTFNVALEKECANGPKKQSDVLYADQQAVYGISRQFDGYQANGVSTSLKYKHSETLNRKDTTAQLFEQNLYPVAWNNDKLVAKCVNGKWKIPSHGCTCEDKLKAMKKRCADMVDHNFNGICKAGGGMDLGSSSTGSIVIPDNNKVTAAPGPDVQGQIDEIREKLQNQGLSTAEINAIITSSLTSRVQETNDRLTKLDQKNIDLVRLIEQLGEQINGGQGVIAGSSIGQSSSAFAVKLGYGLVPIAFVQALHGL